jgi:hypothetical protein
VLPSRSDHHAAASGRHRGFPDLCRRGRRGRPPRRAAGRPRPGPAARSGAPTAVLRGFSRCPGNRAALRWEQTRALVGTGTATPQEGCTMRTMAATRPAGPSCSDRCSPPWSAAHGRGTDRRGHRPRRRRGGAVVRERERGIHVAPEPRQHVGRRGRARPGTPDGAAPGVAGGPLPAARGREPHRPGAAPDPRAAVDWSDQLLPEPDRRLFLRLADFAGGWTLEAAQAVRATPPVRCPRAPLTSRQRRATSPATPAP